MLDSPALDSLPHEDENGAASVFDANLISTSVRKSRKHRKVLRREKNRQKTLRDIERAQASGLTTNQGVNVLLSKVVNHKKTLNKILSWSEGGEEHIKPGDMIMSCCEILQETGGWYFSSNNLKVISMLYQVGIDRGLWGNSSLGNTEPTVHEILKRSREEIIPNLPHGKQKVVRRFLENKFGEEWDSAISFDQNLYSPEFRNISSVTFSEAKILSRLASRVRVQEDKNIQRDVFTDTCISDRICLPCIVSVSEEEFFTAAKLIDRSRKNIESSKRTLGWISWSGVALSSSKACLGKVLPLADLCQNRWFSSAYRTQDQQNKDYIEEQRITNIIKDKYVSYPLLFLHVWNTSDNVKQKFVSLSDATMEAKKSMGISKSVFDTEVPGVTILSDTLKKIPMVLLRLVRS